MANEKTSLYAPLDQASRSIRLIEIQPDHTETPIRCKFHIADLSDYPHYTALSYTWGPPAPTQEIFINGYPVQIRANLWHAIRSIRKKVHAELSSPISEWVGFGDGKHLSYQWTPRYYWIDAICIQQSDVRERNHQVGIMGSIFSQAEVVLVWLGSECDGSTEAITEIQRGCNKDDNVVNNDDDDDENNDNDDDDESDSESIGNFDPKIRKAKIALLNRSYWSRLWIVQEIVMASKRLVLCGDVVCSWTLLKRAVDRLANKSTKAHCVVKAQGESILQRTPAETLVDLLWWFDGQECEDPRDKIYGLLGLLFHLDETDAPLTADYRKSEREVLVDVVQSLKTAKDGHNVSRWRIHHAILQATSMLGIKKSRVRASFLGLLLQTRGTRVDNLLARNRYLRPPDKNKEPVVQNFD
jgi:hypothetical protein